MIRRIVERPPGTYTVLLPARAPEKIRRFLPIAAALAQQNNGRVVLVGVVEAPDEQARDASAAGVDQLRAVYAAVLTPDSVPVPVQSRVIVAPNLTEGIRSAVAEVEANLLLLGWSAEQSSSERLFGQPINGLLRQPPCDVIVARLRGEEPWQRLLLPVRGGPHTALACDIALSLAEYADAMISVLYAANPRRPDDAAVREGLQDLRTMPRVTRWLERAIAIEQAISVEAADHEAIVLGLTGRPDDPEAPLGRLADRILRHVDRSIFLVRHALAPTEEQAQQIWQQKYDLAATVDTWFAANTFSAAHYADAQRLLTLKRNQGVTISLVMATLNAESTLEPILARLRAELLEATPLLDEIVLVDGGSDDQTAAIAAAHGAELHRHAEILPQYGNFFGKGEALWKSLYLLNGDIIVWCDPKVSNFHTGMVTGVLGPLLHNRALVFSKGFYQRTIEVGEPIVVSGGGRLTELTARPLLNMFYPELAGMLQPLAGEFAGRRSALEAAPLFTSYGMEAGLLIDLLEQHGLDALAQVDMIEPIQRHQEPAPRSRIAFSIAQVILQRVEQRQRISLMGDQTLKLITQQPEGGYHLELRELRDHERPPMIQIPEYRRLRGVG
jgi:nucleotide-binding universal stress UspA family protein